MAYGYWYGRCTYHDQSTEIIHWSKEEFVSPNSCHQIVGVKLCVALMVPVGKFSSINSYWQSVLFWREGTGGVGIEGAWWIIGSVEIKSYLAFLRDVASKETCGTVRFLSAC